VRLFVAIFPPETVCADLRGRITGALTRSARKVRLTPMDRWHLTVSFLGEVPQERLPEAERALDEVSPPGPIRLRISGGGSFGRGRSAVLWAGVDGELTALTDLHARIREGLQSADLPYDERPLTPHLTVAYASSPEVREALAGYAGPSWTADRFVLVRSLHAEGGGYRNLRSWPLG
jgi:RNA 2',3'-cyclic 3'-phosphodiesterase